MEQSTKQKKDKTTISGAHTFFFQFKKKITNGSSHCTAALDPFYPIIFKNDDNKGGPINFIRLFKTTKNNQSVSVNSTVYTRSSLSLYSRKKTDCLFFLLRLLNVVNFVSGFWNNISGPMLVSAE